MLINSNTYLVKKTALVTLILFSVSCFYACTHKSATVIPIVTNDTTATNNNHDTTTVATDTSVCFQRDVLPVFRGSCAKSGCHDAITAKKGYNLSTYTGILAKGLVKGNSAASKVYTECTKGKMPQSPTPKLDSTQLSYIKRWIDKGAPNDTNCAVVCDTTKFTYAAAIAPILKSNCYSCHASAVASSSGGGIILDNYSSLLVQAQNGKLLSDLEHLTGFNAMPLGGNKLADCIITQIRKWIDAGAQNN